MPHKKPSEPARPFAPVAETLSVLTALEPLTKDDRITALLTAIAFYGIGNAELEPIRKLAF